MSTLLKLGHDSSMYLCYGLFVIRVSTVSYAVYDTCRALNVVLQVVRSYWRSCLKNIYSIQDI